MGSIFSKPKVSKVTPQAPQVDTPTPEPVEPELGPDKEAEDRRKKGKSALKIDLRASGGSGSGANIV